MCTTHICDISKQNNRFCHGILEHTQWMSVCPPNTDFHNVLLCNGGGIQWECHLPWLSKPLAIYLVMNWGMELPDLLMWWWTRLQTWWGNFKFYPLKNVPVQAGSSRFTQIIYCHIRELHAT